MARVRTQIRRKRYADRLRDSVQLALEMAITDNLTGLHNRHYLERHLGTLVEQATKRGRPLSLLLIDIDYFKVINDTHGHLSGDKVLVGFADRIRSAVRGVDLASRFGGEEFVVAMPDASAEVANHVGERLRGLISAKPFEIGEEREPVSVTASIGVASIQGPEDNAAGLLARADAGLYEAKRSGRNRVSQAALIFYDVRQFHPTCINGQLISIIGRLRSIYNLSAAEHKYGRC